MDAWLPHSTDGASMSPFELSKCLTLAAAGVLSLTGLTGCSSDSSTSSPAAPQTTASLSQSAPAPVAPATEDPDSIRLQSDTVDAYTRDLQAAIAKRAATRPSAHVSSAPTPAAPTPTVVVTSTALAQPFSFELPADP